MNILSKELSYHGVHNIPIDAAICGKFAKIPEHKLISDPIYGNFMSYLSVNFNMDGPYFFTSASEIIVPYVTPLTSQVDFIINLIPNTKNESTFNHLTL